MAPLPHPACLAFARFAFVFVAWGLVPVLPAGAAETTQVFSNPAPITIQSLDAGVGSPYPSNITVSGLTGTVIAVTVTLSGLTHTYPSDLGALLVAPGGQRIRLFTDVGGTIPIAGVNLTLSANAAGPLPENGPLVTGTFLPTLGTQYFDGYLHAANFAAPAPTAPYSLDLNTLIGSAAPQNGTWTLYVDDDTEQDGGAIAGGWSVAITTTSSSVTVPGAPTVTTATGGNTQVKLAFTAPASDGGIPITGYTATCNPGAFSASGAASPLIVPGLANGTAYTCSVTARNYFGNGPPSNSVSSTPGVTVPGAPPRSDLNGDGKSDLLFADAAGNIAAWTMNGTGVLNAAGLLPAGSGWSVTHVADFDGDGKADLLLRHTDGRVLMWIMNGTAPSAQILLQPAASGWSVTHVADMNGDGKADIQWENTAGFVAAWLMNGGTLSSAAVLQGAGSGWHITHMADLNGDGKADILWQHADGTTVAWIMDGLNYVSSAGFTPAGSGWSITGTGDVNGDGKADLVFRNSSGAMMLWVMNGTNLITFAAMQNAGSPWRIDLIGDLDGDGKADLIWRNTADGSTYATLMNGTATVNAGFLFGGGSGWTATHLRDLNGDGKQDILWRYVDGTLATWIMNGLGPIAAAGLIGPSTWQVVPPSP